MRTYLPRWGPSKFFIQGQNSIKVIDNHLRGLTHRPRCSQTTQQLLTFLTIRAPIHESNHGRHQGGDNLAGSKGKLKMFTNHLYPNRAFQPSQIPPKKPIASTRWEKWKPSFAMIVSILGQLTLVSCKLMMFGFYSKLYSRRIRGNLALAQPYQFQEKLW